MLTLSLPTAWLVIDVLVGPLMVAIVGLAIGAWLCPFSERSASDTTAQPHGRAPVVPPQDSGLIGSAPPKG
jgi:hypothetical protein